MRKLKLLACLMVILAITAGLSGTSVRAADPVKIRWFVGLGTGSETEKIPVQEEVVKAFNESHPDIILELEIVANNDAYTALNTQFAAGNAPDVVGPVGIRGRDQFPGAWLDLSDLIKETNYDLSDFDPALVDFYNVPGQGQLGLPFGIYPSFLFVNTDLFDEAGLPYPPAKFGEPYVDKDGNSVEWNMDTLRTLAMDLTVDTNGLTPNDEGFDADQIVQFGFGAQWTDLRGRCSLFGAALPVDADGKAVFPESWSTCTQWFQDAMWKDHFHPNGPYGGSDILNKSNWFQSGNIAMVQVHTWYFANLNDSKFNWNLAVVPSYNGKATAKLHADTFMISKATKHPKEAFAVLSYLVGEASGKLTTLYGAMPARKSLQADYLAKLGESPAFAGREGMNMQVIPDSAAYNDNPNHEAGLPNALESSDRITKFWTALENDPAFDLAVEIPLLVADLQTIYDVK
ncbi:hypothetical protein ARNL5_02473 [Anaerolineae bacterium]|nr:hypothetical protein ARNL5_02473 [Anaerolineae bacterium]